MAEWVLTPALCREDSQPLWDELGLQRPCSAPQQGYRWDVKLLTPTQEDAARVGPLEMGGEAEQGVELPQGWQDALTWTYPHQVSAQMPSKLTATQLKGRDKDAEAAQDGVEFAPAKPTVTLRRPVFQGQRPLTPAQQGTALHMVMQYLNFDRTGSLEEVQEEIARLQEEVRLHDPVCALDGKEDGLYFYRRIVKESRQHLKKGGLLIFEIGYDQAEDVKRLMEEAGYSQIYVKKDLAGLDRVVGGVYNKARENEEELTNV